MSIVFSAIVPHSPLLMPLIGKENRKRLDDTLKAYKKLEEDLYASQAEIILVISPHGPGNPDSFTMNLNPKFICTFEEFGDLTTKIEITGDVGDAYKIREKMETSVPLQLISVEKLDHGVSIPLYLLASHMPQVKVIPIYYSGLDLEAHFKFGQELKKELVRLNARIAVVASGDLSHRLTKEAPAGYSAKGKKFDKKIIDQLLAGQTKDIIATDKKVIEEAQECGLKSIAILLGVLDGIKNEPELLAYEFPFGVGYMTMNFKI